jgi:hypothetical protein
MSRPSSVMCRGRCFQPGDQPQQRGLAAARGADEDDELALLDRQVDALDGAQVAEVLFDALELQE